RVPGVHFFGVATLRHSLAGYGGFTTRGFHIAALLDADPKRIGEKIAGLVVRHIDELPEVVSELDIAIGVIATPAHAAQAVCDQLVDCGVTSILNFAPTVLVVPDGVDVRKVDLAIELQILSFHEQRKIRPIGGSALEGVGCASSSSGCPTGRHRSRCSNGPRSAPTSSPRCSTSCCAASTSARS